MRNRHVSWEEILDVLESTGSADPTVRSHLTICPRCARLAEEARMVLGLLADARIPLPPSSLVERTLARLQALSGQAVIPGAPQPESELRELLGGLKSTFREAWATLVADSLQPSPALRGTSVAPARVLRYETPDFVVTLSLAPGAARHSRDLLGQLVPRRGLPIPPGTCASVARGDKLIEARIGATGEFSLSGVPASSDEIGILAGDDWIRLRLPK
jgi:hypothetical protein